jgi:transcriptional regulator with XRE-family HTH domain
VRARHPVTIEDTVRWDAMRAVLRRRRIDLGLRQRDVAERMGRSQDYVSILENGPNIPNVRTVWLWAEALGMTIAFEDQPQG